MAGGAAETTEKDREAYQDAREDLWMLGIYSPLTPHVLQVAVQECAHDTRVVHDQRPHDLASFVRQLLESALGATSAWHGQITLKIEVLFVWPCCPHLLQGLTDEAPNIL